MSPMMPATTGTGFAASPSDLGPVGRSQSGEAVATVPSCSASQAQAIRW